MPALDAARSPASAARKVAEQLRSQRHRLAKVVDLARVYRGCGVEELARHLGRDPTRLVSDSGNPKVDLIVGLSRVLEWPITEVVKAIRGDEDLLDGAFRGTSTCQHAHARLKHAELNERSLIAHRAGRWQEMLAIATTMLAKSTSTEERAIAFSRLGCPFDSMGRYASALKAWQAGLAEPEVSDSVRMMLQANLANAHYTLWNLVEARTLATEVIEKLADPRYNSRSARVLKGMTHYVRASTYRRMIARDDGTNEKLIAQARSDFKTSESIYISLAEEFNDDSYRGVANTCVGALVEVDAASDAIDPVDATRLIEAGIAEAFRGRSMPFGDRLESWGWWAIFGSNIALRHLPIGSSHDQVARFQEYLRAAAEGLENWGFRAKAFSIELERRGRCQSHGISLGEWNLTPHEVQTLTHTMARLPAFQANGWRILTEFGALERAKKIDPRTWRKGLLEA